MRSLGEIIGASIYQVRNRKISALSNELAERQWWPTHELLKFCDRRTEELLDYAIKSVPYYGDLFRTLGIGSSNVELSAVWDRIPVLDKETLRREFENLKGDEKHTRQAVSNASGGSTGVPVSFLSDSALFYQMGAFLNLVFSWAGWRIGEPIMEIWGTKRQVLPLPWYDVLKALLERRVMLSARTYDRKIFAEWERVLKWFRPTIIYGYPSVIAIFARWLEEKGRKPQSIKGVFCSAENLIPAHKKILERVFGCKVFNQYGSRETPAVACECPEGNMHIFIDLNRVEFVDSGSAANNQKNIIATPLLNYAQPLLRYDTGDIGRAADKLCTCGRGYPLMQMIFGRQNDHLLAQDGKRVYASYFHHLLDGIEWVRSFQFRQTRIGAVKLTVEVDKLEGVDDRLQALRDQLILELQSAMGSEVELEVEAVPMINRSAAGKHRFVINEIEDGKPT